MKAPRSVQQTVQTEQGPAKRFRAECPHCTFAAVRAKREAAEHALDQHLAYEHGVEDPRSQERS